MQRIILALFVLFILEIVVLIEVGKAINPLNTILLMFVGMIAGFVLIKLRFRKVVEMMQRGGVPDFKVLFLPLSGFLFLFPGFISDILGLLLLIPSVRDLTVKKFAGSASGAFGTQGSRGTARTEAERFGGKIVEAEYTEVKETEDKKEPD